MPRKKGCLDKRNIAIVKRYKELDSKTTTNGVKLYRYEAVLTMLGEEFYLTPVTIQRIILTHPDEN